MKTLFLIFLLILSHSAISQLNENVSIDTLKFDFCDEILIPNHYIITKTNAAIQIDGIPESAWDQAAFTSEFIDIEGVKKVKYSTTTKMLWDEDYLYVYAELEEPHIWGNLKQRDTIIYFNNDFEVFIDPSGKGANYGEIEINALNTVWDLLLNKPYRVGGFANFHWNLDSLKSAVKVYGNLNDPKGKDEKWTVEMAIPMKALIELKNDHRQPIKEGDQWRMNFSRVQWQHDLEDGIYSRKRKKGVVLPESNWVWSNQNVINMHVPENWGVVQFTETNSSDGISYNQDPDQEIKQSAFALFRQFKSGYFLSQQPAMGGSKPIIVTYSKDKTALASLLKTSFGFEISITSPITTKTYIINQLGELKEQL